MEFAYVRPGDILECEVRGYRFIARFEGIEPCEFLGERVRVTPLSPDGTEDPPESTNLTFFRIGKTEALKKLKPKHVAAWELPGGDKARQAYAPRGPRRVRG